MSVGKSNNTALQRGAGTSLMVSPLQRETGLLIVVSHDDQLRKSIEQVMKCSWLYEHFDVPLPKDFEDAAISLRAMVDDGTTLFLPILFEINALRDRVAALENRAKNPDPK